MMSTCVNTPIAADARTPATTASQVGKSASVAATYAYAPTAAIAPCAKLRTPDPRYTSTMPCAASA